MELEEAITSHLLSRPGLTALIDRRFYFDELPAEWTLKTGPAVVCLQVSDIKLHTHDGQLALESPLYQFTAYASTKLAVKAVATQIKAALCDYKGDMGGLYAQYVRLMNELTGLETSADGAIKVHTTDLEFEFNYEKE